MRSFLLAILVPLVALAQGAGQARLVVEAPDFDFGRLEANAEVTHSFRISNGGEGLLRITRLVPACGCTSALAGKDVLAAGESTEIAVTFRAAGISGKAHKVVEVDAETPLAVKAFLNFQAEVQRAVAPETESVRFQDLTRKDRRKASVRLVSGTGKAILVEDVQLSEAPWLGVATRQDGLDQVVDLDLLARRLPAGKLEGTDTIALHLRNPQDSTVNLEVHWALRPPVEVEPARVAWTGPAGQALQAPLTLRHPGRRPFRILSARTSNPLLQVLGVPAAPAASQVVQVLLAAGALPGTYDEKVFLTLDTPGHPELAIRVSAVLD